jgi:OFA family oxalate/formate antiporter-like MFS transporter
MSDKTASPSQGWIVTLAGLCINLALGVLYTWSVFTAKFTTVVTYGANGVVQKAGEDLAGAAPILASEASKFGIKVPAAAAGAPYGAADFVGQLDKTTGMHKVSKVGAQVLNEGAFNWSGTDALLPYAVALLVFGFTMVFAGRLQDKYGPRLVATVGGVLVGIGMVTASFSEFTPGGNHTLLILGFGVLTGMGIGLAYASATPAAVKWFHPSKRGFIAGLVVAGFGLASVYTAPTTTALIGSSGLKGTFFNLGIAFLVAIILFAQLLKNPPTGYTPPVPANFKAPATASAASAMRGDYTWQEMLRTPQFYLLWIMYAFASFAGLMMVGVIAKVAPMQLSADDMAKMALTGALAGASLLVVALAVGNGAGRWISGIVSDKIGRVPSMIIAFLSQAVLVGFLLPNAHSLTLLLLWSGLIGAMYGANLTLFPTATYDFFGTKNGGVNYGLVFSAWGVGGALGNYAIGWIYDLSGKTSFNNAYYLAAALLVVASVLALVVRAPGHERASSPELAAQGA